MNHLLQSASAGLAGFAVWLAVTTALSADGSLRIETEVRSGADGQVVSGNLTLFVGGVVYDFRIEPGTGQTVEVVIYDGRDKRFVLLDVERQVRTEISRPQLLQLVAELRDNSDLRDKALWLVEPSFVEHYSASSGWLQLEQQHMTYRTRGERPRDANILPLYYEYLDDCARLNATDPRKLPPFCRLRLNAAIKKHGFIPTEVELAIQASDLFPEPLTASTHHYLAWQVSRQDLARIQHAKQQWMSFRRVSLPEYRQAEVGRR